MGPFWTNGPSSVFSVSPEFWLYWAIVLPLTTVVMVVWQTWLWMYRKHRARRLKDIEENGALGSSNTPSATSSTSSFAPSSQRGGTSQRVSADNIGMEGPLICDHQSYLHEWSGSFVSARSARNPSHNSLTSIHSRPSIASQASERRAQ